MKNIHEVLQQKMRDLDRLIKEIQSLKHSIEILREDGDPQLGSPGVNYAPVPTTPAVALNGAPAKPEVKRWP